MFGGQWPHSSFMVPGGVMCAPTLAEVSRSIAILENWKDAWLEGQWLGCSIDRWLENKTWDDVLAWVDENESQRESDCGFFIRYAMEIGLDKFGQGVGNYLATGTYFEPSLYENPTVDDRNAALINRSGVYANGQFSEFDHMRVAEDTAHSYFEGSGLLHPWDGRTVPVDPEQGRKNGKYSWAKSPRYDVPGAGHVPLEAGPLARRVAAAAPGAQGHQDDDPLFLDIINKIGPSVLTRQLARMHEGPKYFKWARKWLDDIQLKESFYTKPVEHESGKGFGSTEAARGSLSDWIVIEDGKIENYQVVTPTAWNIGPRDGQGAMGPIEQALVGSPDRRPVRPGRTRARRSQLRLVPRLYRSRLRREDRKGAFAVRRQRDGMSGADRGLSLAEARADRPRRRAVREGDGDHGRHRLRQPAARR